jgi:hypothetical protein
LAVLSINMIAFGGTYFGLPKGTIYLAYVDYNDPNTIDVTAGYGECNGNYWEITTTTSHDLTSLASDEDFHYVYIDDANSCYPTPTLYDSTTEPSWSNSKLGWYNSNDRCIGVVWSPSSSTTILEFTTNSDLKYVYAANGPQPVTNANPTGSAIFAEATAYTPVNTIAVKIQAWNNSTGYCNVNVYADSNLSNVLRGNGYGGFTYAIGWITFKRGDSRDLYWLGEDNDNNLFNVRIDGYKIER